MYRGQNEKVPHWQAQSVSLHFELRDRTRPMPAGIAMPRGLLLTGRKIPASKPTDEASLGRVFGWSHLQAWFLRRTFLNITLSFALEFQCVLRNSPNPAVRRCFGVSP